MSEKEKLYRALKWLFYLFIGFFVFVVALSIIGAISISSV